MSRTAPGTPQKVYYKIGEVCEITDTQPYVLRFWESEFPQLAPRKNRSGQRVYERGDIDIVMRIKKLLYEEEYTIAGARRKLDEEANVPQFAAGSGTLPGSATGSAQTPLPEMLEEEPAARPSRQVVVEEDVAESREPDHPVDDLTARATRPRLVQSPETAPGREARLEKALGELKSELRGLLSDLRKQV
jgi:DNA-binding transcriptional MerR regulator